MDTNARIVKTMSIEQRRSTLRQRGVYLRFIRRRPAFISLAARFCNHLDRFLILRTHKIGVTFRARFRQTAGNDLTDAAPAAGHNCGFAFQAEHVL